MTTLLQQTLELRGDKGHTLAMARRGQAQGKTVGGNAIQGQQAVQAIKAGGDGCRRCILHIGNAAPQRHMEHLLQARAIVDALVQQVQHIDGQQAHGHASGNSEQQHQQALGKHACRVEGGVFDQGDVADLAVVQFVVDSRLFKIVRVQGVAFFGGAQLLAQGVELRFIGHRLVTLGAQFGKGLVVVLDFPGQFALLQLGVDHLLFNVDHQAVGRGVLRAFQACSFLGAEGFHVADVLLDLIDLRRARQVSAQQPSPLHLQRIKLALEVELGGVEAGFAHRDHVCRLALDLLAGVGQQAANPRDLVLGADLGVGDAVDLVGQVLQARIDTDRVDLLQAALQLVLQALDILRHLGAFGFIEGVQALAPENPRTFFKVGVDPGLDDFLRHRRVVPGEGNLDHRRTRLVAGGEVLLQ